MQLLMEFDRVEPAALPGSQAMTERARGILTGVGASDLAARVRVEWSARLSSTAGLAFPQKTLVRLNPRLVAFPGEVDRTLLHELAHLLAHARSGRKRIPAHGPEWRQACADLGIANEKVSHRLALPRSKRKRPYRYVCPRCNHVFDRCRRFARDTACGICCRKHSRNQYNADFRLVLMSSKTTGSRA